MGLSEICYRISNKLHAALEKHGIGLAMVPPTPEARSGRAWVDALPVGFERASYTNAADRVMSGVFDVFNMKATGLGFPPNWLRDCRTGRVAPLSYGKTMDYRNEAIVGDIKYLWEPNRHLELVTLAQAWHLTGEPEYANACRTLLDSWIDGNPYPSGPNWISSLEHAVRLVNWSVAWHLLGADDSILFASDDGMVFKQRWLTSIYQHCHFISGHFSRYSSANNHLLGEYMGLLVASTTWPCWPKSEVWLNLAHRGFEAEALRQNAEDGVNREQGIWYHHEVADMMLVCGLIGRANGRDFSPAYWKRLETMLDFIASVMDVGGNMPMIGDADDAVMVRFNPLSHNVYRSLLATGAVVFGRGDFKHKACKFDDKSRWLLGDLAAIRFNELSTDDIQLPINRVFSQGGYWVLGANLEQADEVRIIADAGPLGYLSIAAHGHADALAFTLSVAGNEILIDPGTFAYHTQKKWRDYFRGTSAHNTIRIDQQDQSISGGNFLWNQHAVAQCSRFETSAGSDVWVASHDGYSRLHDPVMHERMLILNKAVNTLLVKDRLIAQKSHIAEIYWHIAEACNVEVVENCAIVKNSNSQVSIRLLNLPWQAELFSGSDKPPLGWISRGFDSKMPTTTLRWTGEITATTEIHTEICIEML